MERFNRSLLQMFHSYAKSKEEWEKYLLLVLYTYCTAIHSSTGFAPFELMHGRPPQQALFEQFHSFDTDMYEHHLQAKLAEMHDFVETGLTDRHGAKYIGTYLYSSTLKYMFLSTCT